MEHGLIAYRTATPPYSGLGIFISWERINTFCALKKPLPKRGGKFSPVRLYPPLPARFNSFGKYWLSLSLEEQTAYIKEVTGRDPLPIINTKELDKKERKLIYPYRQSEMCEPIKGKPEWVLTYDLPF